MVGLDDLRGLFQPTILILPTQQPAWHTAACTRSSAAGTAGEQQHENIWDAQTGVLECSFAVSVFAVLTPSSRYTSLITLLWRAVDIQLSLPSWRRQLTTKAVEAASLRFPIQLELKAKEVEKWSSHP